MLCYNAHLEPSISHNELCAAGGVSWVKRQVGSTGLEYAQHCHQQVVAAVHHQAHHVALAHTTD